jgi:hypothetical protein
MAYYLPGLAEYLVALYRHGDRIGIKRGRKRPGPFDVRIDLQRFDANCHRPGILNGDITGKGAPLDEICHSFSF